MARPCYLCISGLIKSGAEARRVQQLVGGDWNGPIGRRGGSREKRASFVKGDLLTSRPINASLTRDGAASSSITLLMSIDSARMPFATPPPEGLCRLGVVRGAPTKTCVWKLFFFLANRASFFK